MITINLAVNIPELTGRELLELSDLLSFDEETHPSIDPLLYKLDIDENGFIVEFHEQASKEMIAQVCFYIGSVFIDYSLDL